MLYCKAQLNKRCLTCTCTRAPGVTAPTALQEKEVRKHLLHHHHQHDVRAGYMLQLLCFLQVLVVLAPLGTVMAGEHPSGQHPSHCWP